MLSLYIFSSFVNRTSNFLHKPVILIINLISSKEKKGENFKCTHKHSHFHGSTLKQFVLFYTQLRNNRIHNCKKIQYSYHNLCKNMYIKLVMQFKHIGKHYKQHQTRMGTLTGRDITTIVRFMS